MINVVYAAISIGIVSIVSFVGIFTIALKEIFLRCVICVLVALAVGTLLGDALIHLLPEAIEEVGGTSTAIAAMAGILLFFALEKFLSWHHSHGKFEESRDTIKTHEHSAKKIAPLVLVADSVHNAIDGIIIGASFLISVPVGVATTLAVILHEIPQEIADFGLFNPFWVEQEKSAYMEFYFSPLCFFGASCSDTCR